MEGKLVCYLRWINMYSSAGSNQGHNRFIRKNKFAWRIFEMTLFFELDPPECVLLSPCGRLSIVHAMLSCGQISTRVGGWGVVGRSLQLHSLYSVSCLWLLMSLQACNYACHIFKMKPDGFSMTFWTLILQGFFLYPPHTFTYSPGLLQRYWLGL